MSKETDKKLPPSPLQCWTQSRIAQRSRKLRENYYGKLFIATIDERRIGTSHCRIGNQWFVNFGLADAFGLGCHPDILKQAGQALEQWGTFFGASRIYQFPELYRQLERSLAQMVGAEQAVAFNSVTTIHCGVLASLAPMSKCTLFIDRFAHNSLSRAADLCAARGAEIKRFPHNDTRTLSKLLEKTNTFPVIVVDSVYSMGGDFAPLKEIHKLVTEHNGLLYVDDAHGTGMYGPQGGGYVRETLGRIPENTLVVGSLSKVVSGCGAFLACSNDYRELVELSSEGYIFNGPIPPASLAGDIAAVDILRSREYPGMRDRLHDRQEQVRAIVTAAGRSILESKSHIIAIPMGEREASQTAAQLFEHGILVNLALFPAVPRNTGILRLTPSLLHSDEDIKAFADAMSHCR